MKENRPFLRNPDGVRQQKSNDKLVLSTLQLIQEFKKKHGGIKEIKELQNQLIISSVKIDNDENNKSLPIPAPMEVSSTTNTFQIDLSIKQEPIIEIKEEPSELKLELKEEDEANASDILGLLCHEEDLSNSSDSSLSRLPAFCANRFFDGNRFVSRSELLESKLKNGQRKRERRPHEWAAAIQKKLRNHGQQYRSVKGNVVAARKLGMPCNCRKNCGAKISENNRVANFKQYWEIESHVDKRKFLTNHIKLLKPKRALTKNRIFSRIMHHFLDVVNYDGSTEKIRVCKKMFCSTFAISNSVISNAFKILSKDHEMFFEH